MTLMTLIFVNLFSVKVWNFLGEVPYLGLKKSFSARYQNYTSMGFYL